MQPRVLGLARRFDLFFREAIQLRNDANVAVDSVARVLLHEWVVRVRRCRVGRAIHVRVSRGHHRRAALNRFVPANRAGAGGAQRLQLALEHAPRFRVGQLFAELRRALIPPLLRVFERAVGIAPHALRGLLFELLVFVARRRCGREHFVHVVTRLHVDSHARHRAAGLTQVAAEGRQARRCGAEQRGIDRRALRHNLCRRVSYLLTAAVLWGAGYAGHVSLSP